MFGWTDTRSNATPDDAVGGTAANDILITGQAGLLAGMHIATAQGWRAAETLRVGDMVLSFDHGMQPILDIQRETVMPAENGVTDDQMPIRVPGGAVGNKNDIWLMPDQGIMVESDTVMDVRDDPFAIVPASALRGFRGIRAEMPKDPLRVTTLAFQTEEVIYIEGGLLAHCPRPQPILMQGAAGPAGFYAVLNARAARYLVACLIEDNDIRALVCDPEEIAEVAAIAARHSRHNLTLASSR